MLCITVVSRGEFNSICSQASWEQGFTFNALNTNFGLRHRRERAREGDRTSSLQQWQEHVLTQPMSGPCPKSFETKGKSLIDLNGHLTKLYIYNYQTEILKSLEVYFKCIINIQDLANKFQIKINLLWNYYISFPLHPLKHPLILHRL